MAVRHKHTGAAPGLSKTSLAFDSEERTRFGFKSGKKTYRRRTKRWGTLLARDGFKQGSFRTQQVTYQEFMLVPELIPGWG
ncbi:MAG: hypothetical protein DMF60_00890 [Acidobacteria bacterium]|nr:MAG: hypothetical protein DMF60_00890 [Acidobacteriota bacterium]